MHDEDLEDDAALWQQVVTEFTPLKNKKPQNLQDLLIASQPKVIEINTPPPEFIPPAVKQEIKENFLEAGDLHNVDGSLAQKLKDGEYPIDARLDLHGQTQDEAFESLRYFIATAYSIGKRCILVITGKGIEGNGILREQLPKWLNTTGIKEYILAFTQAKPKHGGSGAFYVLLRKNK